MAARDLDPTIRTHDQGSEALKLVPHVVDLDRAAFLGGLHAIRDWLEGPEAEGRYATSVDGKPGGGVTYHFDHAPTAALMRDMFGGR